MDAYERLLGDAMAGEATFFARENAVEAAWAVVRSSTSVTVRASISACCAVR